MKTIFLTLSSPAVYRNQLFYPRSVYERLCEMSKADQNFRLVFLVNQKDLERYTPYFESKGWLSERCVIEPVKLEFDRNFVQKAFKFFSSYLLYTNTTRILATMGMRPGEPPAGGNYYLVPLKWFLARTFGRSKFIKDKVVPWFYYRAYPERPFKPLFEKYKPDLVFIGSIYDRFDYRLLPEAKLWGVKTVGTPSGWDHVDKYHLPFKTDLFLAQNEQVRQATIRFQGYAPEKVLVTGFPYFDFLLDKESDISRTEILKKLNLPADARYFLYVSGSAYCPDEPDVIEKMLSWVSEDKFGKDVYIVVRPYVGGRGKDAAFDAEKYARLTTHPRVRFYDARGWGDMKESAVFMSLIRYAGAVMAVYSTFFLEACVFDRPLLAAPFDGYHKRPLYRSIRRFEGFEHFQDVIKTGALRRAFNFDELFTALKEYLADPDVFSKERAVMRREICGIDGSSSSEKTVKAIIESLPNS